nr:receptor like protein 30-like isoform X2 [Ipomoea trifida]
MQALERAEGRALLQWKETLSYTDGVLDSWSLSNLKNICNWTGITCNTAMYVSKMNLSGYDSDLKGPFPTNFTSLSMLKILDLYDNHFYGIIPQEIQALERSEGKALLQWKKTLSNTDVLRSWSLSNLNNICNWTGITCNSAATYVSEINFNLRGYFNPTGTLKHFDFISFPELTHFDLSDNGFTGSIPETIANLSKLTYLDLSYNLFERCIPLGIAMLTRLRHLDLDGNNLNGTIPNQISHLQNLEYLGISRNSFGGKFPESIFSNLTKLQSFICMSNQFQDPIPFALPNFPPSLNFDYAAEQKDCFLSSPPPPFKPPEVEMTGRIHSAPDMQIAPA